jgi:membrane-associated HD superfamily phosphohydrolase
MKKIKQNSKYSFFLNSSFFIMICCVLLILIFFKKELNNVLVILLHSILFISLLSTLSLSLFSLIKYEKTIASIIYLVISFILIVYFVFGFFLGTFVFSFQDKADMQCDDFCFSDEFTYSYFLEFDDLTKSYVCYCQDVDGHIISSTLISTD